MLSHAASGGVSRDVLGRSFMACRTAEVYDPGNSWPMRFGSPSDRLLKLGALSG